MNIDFSSSQSETKVMTTFPVGQLLLREFPTLTEAHQAAARLSSSPTFADSNEFRLIDVSPTAGGAWTCAWISNSNPAANDKVAKENGCELVDVDTTLMNALLSLGPKPSATTTHIGILESNRIADVLRSATTYASAGFTLLEIRVKRAGPTGGAHAFFALDDDALAKLGTTAKPSVTMTTISLQGDYRRYFL